ncbi:CDK-activating kinase assembly factor MAT1-like [Apostichopus japonicus]|uniref:CDK-activating kinase assembly factor MAT1-like n=1 Tax=Stichopus japonicus TaxID=307972 RepID=UPI003AB8FBCB
MEEKGCPRCKTTKYRNPSLKLLVNVCGHSLCENCVELLFGRGSGACPQCNTALRRTQFRLQLFENPTVEREVDIRRRIMKDFNKQEEDFETLDDFNDYLEMVESIIFNLSNGIDVEATKKKVESYKRDNKDLIQRNKLRQSKDILFINSILREERNEDEERRTELLFLEKKIENEKIRNKESLLDELMASDAPADEVIASHQSNDVRITIGKVKVGSSFGETFLPAPQVQELTYEYICREINTFGPGAPMLEDLDSKGFTQHVRPSSPQSMAGGFTHVMACHRALQEALSGLFFFPHRPQVEHR